MKFSKKLSALAVASALSVPALMVAAPAQAEMSATFAASNMYLWRGVNLTENGAAISGSLDYANASGFYAGIWTTTETDGHETDLYLGFSGEAAGIGYDISFWEYLYPEEGTNQGLGDTDTSEIVLGLTYADFGFGYYLTTDSDVDDNSYITLSYGVGPVDITYGFWSLENPGNEYSHITLGYAATDELSFGVSVASNDVDDDAAGAVETDPLFTVTYTKSFDL